MIAKRVRATKTLVAVLILSLSAADCASYEPIRVTQVASDPSLAQVQAIRVNDKVKLHLRDQSRVEIRVARVEPETLVGALGERVPVGDVLMVERLEYDSGSTKALILGITGVIALAALVRHILCCVNFWYSV